MPHSFVGPASADGLTRFLSQRQFAPVDRASGESAETIYRSLDGRELTVLGRRWRVEVFSVLELAGRRYVQLSVDGPERYMLTLRMNITAEARQAVNALLPWLARPAASGEVIDVDPDQPPPEGQRPAE